LTPLFPAPVQWRLYRLTDLSGNTHPVLDDLYESFDAAWLDALAWSERMGDNPNEPVAIGVEVSSPNGNWRTLQYPCQNRLQSAAMPGLNLTKRRHPGNP
jgi:hypothetical protein